MSMPKEKGFASAVYGAVRRIPKGRVMSYGLLAEAIHRPRAARAVGNALHHNPLVGKVPCHRVVRVSGDVGEYIHGRQKKCALLRAEGVAVNAQGKVMPLKKYLTVHCE